MGGAAPDMACRKRLRSRDSARIEVHSDDDEEGNKMRGCVSEVKNGKTSTAAISEKGKQKEGRASSSKNMMADAREKEKKTATWNGHNKLKSREKVSTASLEKMRKKEKLCNTNNKKKMQICDVTWKNRKESTMISEKKNKEKMNKAHKEKMRAADSKERKKISGRNGVKKSGEVSTAFFGKEKKGEMLNKTINEELQSDEDEEEWNCDGKVKNGKVATAFSKEEKRKKRPNNNNTEKETAPLTPAVKEKRMRPSASTEMTMLHGKLNGRNVPSSLSKGKMDTSCGSNYKKRKRKEPLSLSEKEKRHRWNDSDNKMHNGRVKENKICGGGKEKNRHAPFAFFKFIYNYSEGFLLIPPAVAPKLEDLTNHDVYLEDSEKRRSKVRLSVVDGCLAFHQGWDIFVSDHLIKWGEFLLFERIARKTFSVRIFSIDSCERLYFKKDPKRVEYGVGPGPVPQDNNGNLINQQCKTKDTYPLRRNEKTLILISDSGTSAHDEDILNLTTSVADSTHHVTICTNKDPKRVQSGVGNLPDGECGTKCISPTCSEGKTSSEIIKTDAAPLMQENGGRVGHELEVHDSDGDLIRKQGINSIPLDSITVVDKHQNHSEMNNSQNFYRKYAAPGGFRCLEKWSKGIVNSQSALDGTVLIEPESTRKIGSKLVGGCGSVGLNTGNEYFCSEDNHTRVLPVFTMPIKEPTSADRVSKCRYGGTETDHSIKESTGGGAAVQIETQGEQLEPVGSIVNSRKNKIPVPANIVAPCKYGALGLNSAGPEGTCAFVESMLTVPDEKSLSPDGISKCGRSIVNSRKNNIPVPANTVAPCKYGVLGLNSAGPEGTCAFVESMLTVPVEKPLSSDGISKRGSSSTEIGLNVNGKGTIVQLETKMDQVEPMGSSVCSQSSHVATYANHVVAHASEHFFSKQEGGKPMKGKLLELDGHSLLNFSLQLCIPDTTRKWLELPKSLPGAVNKQKRHDRNVIMLKDPINRLWPVLYHENPVFVGFTAGWKHFVAGNNLQTGDLCKLTKDANGDVPVFSVQITKRQL